MVDDITVFTKVMMAMYGAPLEIDDTNLFDILLVAKLLKFNCLLQHCKTLQKEGLQSSPPSFRVNASELMQGLHGQTEVQLEYSGFSLKTNKLFLCCISKYFRKQWCLEWKDSVDYVLEFDDLLKVEKESFETFFSLFKGIDVAISLQNVYEIRYLAVYFEIKPIVAFCDDFLKNSFNEGLIEQASDFNDVLFAETFGSRLEQIKASEGISITPAVFEVLSGMNVDAVFLVKSLKLSWQNKRSAWSVEEFNTYLKTIKCSVDNAPVIHGVLSELLDDDDLELCVSRFLLKLVPLQLEAVHKKVCHEVSEVAAKVDALESCNADLTQQLCEFKKDVPLKMDAFRKEMSTGVKETNRKIDLQQTSIKRRIDQFQRETRTSIGSLTADVGKKMNTLESFKAQFTKQLGDLKKEIEEKSKVQFVEVETFLTTVDLLNQCRIDLKNCFDCEQLTKHRKQYEQNEKDLVQSLVKLGSLPVLLRCVPPQSVWMDSILSVFNAGELHLSYEELDLFLSFCSTNNLNNIRIPKCYKDDEEALRCFGNKKLLRYSDDLLRRCSDRLKDKEDYCRWVMSQELSVKEADKCFKHCSENLRDNEDFCRFAMSRGCCLRRCSTRLRNSVEFVKYAISQNPSNKRYIPSE
ncbi:hypothetical protein P9112_010825 [Eukaryota sp. TZLM1-RC]